MPFFHFRENVGHRVDRVLSFSPVVGIGAPPTPHPQASVLLPPFGSGGRVHLLAGEWAGYPYSNEGTYTVVLKVYTFFVRREYLKLLYFFLLFFEKSQKLSYP